MVKLILKMMLLSLLPTYALSQAVGLGGVAENLMQPVGLFSDFIQTACFAIGGSFLFASVIKYFEHRRSPLMVPFSTVFFLLVAGGLLVLLPFVSFLTENGVPYFLFIKGK